MDSAGFATGSINGPTSHRACWTWALGFALAGAVGTGWGTAWMFRSPEVRVDVPVRAGERVADLERAARLIGGFDHWRMHLGSSEPICSLWYRRDAGTKLTTLSNDVATAVGRPVRQAIRVTRPWVERGAGLQLGVWLGSAILSGALGWTMGGTRKSPAWRAFRFKAPLEMRFLPVVTSTDGNRCVWFAVHQTRVKDYREFAEGQNHLASDWESPLHLWKKVTPEESCPVVNVSREDAREYANWLTDRERKARRIPAGARYRLPTDEEWSWAVGIGPAEASWMGSRSPRQKSRGIAKGTHPFAYPWGGDWPPPSGFGNYADTTAVNAFPGMEGIPGYEDGYPTTSPVGTYQANANGLFDLGSNVHEWVDDSYDGEEGNAVSRGASWHDYGENDLLSSQRTVHSPTGGSIFCGFRLVLDPG